MQQALLMGGAGGPTDPLWSSVAALLHFDVAGTAAPVDVTGRGWARGGTAEQKTDQFKFGPASGYFDAGSASGYGTLNAAPFNPGTGAWTAEMWFRVATGGIGAYRCLFSNYQNSSSGMSLEIDNTGKLAFNATGDGADITGTTTIVVNTWYFVQVICSGSGLITLGLNGVSEGTLVASPNITSGAANFLIGKLGTIEVDRFLGWIDEFRFTSAARTLSLPTAAFPDN